MNGLNWTDTDTWIVVVGFLAAAACGLPGCYLVLRRMSLMGDAISHAVLPGLAIAFLVTGSRASWPMFLGAAVVGVLTAVFTQWIEKIGRVEATASLGIVFTSLFALGLILLRMTADAVDLDPDCVLYGAIELTPLDTIALWGWDVPRAAVVNGSMLLVNAAFIVVFYKELKISSFDPQLATTVGVSASFMHYALMGLIAATVVAAFESVGSILVIAMIVVPGAVGHLLTDRLSIMLLISVVVAALSAALGHLGAIALPPLIPGGEFIDTSTAGMMAVAAGALLVLAVAAGPRYGVVSRWIGRLRLSLRVAEQDILAMLWRTEEWSGGAQTSLNRKHIMEALALGPWSSWAVLTGLARRALVRQDAAGFSLTRAGRDQARDLVRTHRLWETYLARYLHVPIDQLHLSAERLEHATDERLQKALSEKIGSPRLDPQGKQIPPARD